MTELTRIIDEAKHGLHHRRIYGLNIFAANGLAVPASQDPRLLFLRTLAERTPCSAHVGAMALKDLVDAPEELFGSPIRDLTYSQTRVDYYDGFFDLGDASSMDACFFPHVTPPFWEARLPYECDYEGIDYLLPAHGLALYVGPGPSTLDAMADLLRGPFPGEETWLRETASLYRLIVMVGHDGDFLHAFTQDEAQFSLLGPVLARAQDGIRASVWFRENEAALEWEDEWSMCLKVK